jgi:hypothetical protein
MKGRGTVFVTVVGLFLLATGAEAVLRVGSEAAKRRTADTSEPYEQVAAQGTPGAPPPVRTQTQVPNHPLPAPTQRPVSPQH